MSVRSTSALLTSARWLFLATVFALPFSTGHILTDPRAVSLASLLQLGLLGIIVLALATKTLPLRPVPQRSLVIVLAGMAVAIGWGLLNTSPVSDGFGLLLSRFLLPLGFGYAGFLLVQAGSVTLRDLMQTLVASLAALTLLDIGQVFEILPSANPTRPTGTHLYPNTLGRYLTYLLLITGPWVMTRQRSSLVLIWVGGVVALFLTQAYGATIAAMTGLAAMLLLLPPRFARLRQLNLLGLLAFVSVIALNAQSLPKYQETFTDSLASRFEYWSVARQALEGNWLTGLGLKTWELTYSSLVERFGPSPPLNWASPHPHNVFLDSLVKAGIPGLIAITSLMLWPIIVGIPLVQRGQRWWFALGGIGLGVALVVVGLVDDPLWSDDTMPLIFLVLFLLAALPTLPKKTG